MIRGCFSKAADKALACMPSVVRHLKVWWRPKCCYFTKLYHDEMRWLRRQFNPVLLEYLQGNSQYKTRYTFNQARPNSLNQTRSWLLWPESRPILVSRAHRDDDDLPSTPSGPAPPSPDVIRFGQSPGFAGAWRGKKGRAMAGAFALRLVPRLAAEPPGRGKGGGGGASRDAGSRAL